MNQALNALFLGMAIGYFMGVLFIGVGAAILPALRHHPPPFIAPFLRSPSLLIPLSGISFLLWGLVGAGIGGAYLWVDSVFPGNGLGSPNLIFTASFLAFTIVFSLFLRYLSKRIFRWLAIYIVCFAGIFGWLLPYLISQD